MKQLKTLKSSLKKLLFTFLMLTIFEIISNKIFAQTNADIEIKTGSTSGGTWNSSTTPPYIFTPNNGAGSVTISPQDIVDRLQGAGTSTTAGNVTINTACTSGCTGSGNFKVTNTITASVTSATQLTLKVNFAGSVTGFAAVSITGAATGNPGYPGVNLELNSGAGITTANSINTTGGAAASGNNAGGNGGYVKLTASNGNVSWNTTITTSGGNGSGTGAGGNGGYITCIANKGTVTASNTYTSTGGTGGATSGTGGNGGAFNFTGFSTVTESTAISNNGGTGGAPNGRGGNGGGITFNSTAANVVIGDTPNSKGGIGGATNGSGGNGGDFNIIAATTFSSSAGDPDVSGGAANGTGSSGSGGAINITANAPDGGITTTRAYTNSAGTGGSGTPGTAGAHTWTNNNSVVTSGGANDGQSGASLAGGAFVKDGIGTFLLNRANTYTGLTTVKNGILKVNINTSLGTNASGTTVNSGAALDINGINYSTTEALTLNGTGISNGGALMNSTGSGTWAGTVNLASASSIGVTGTQLTISGLISGTGNPGFTKVGVGVLAVSNTGNNYTGTTTITQGTFQINAAGVIPDASNIILNGGTLRTNGAFSETMGTLSVNAGSAITFGNTGAHTLTFANSNGITWTGTLTINGWTGTFGAGTTGTTKIIVGSTGNVLTSTQLSKIQFYNATTFSYWGAQVLSTGE